jgi:hypothetical protein
MQLTKAIEQITSRARQSGVRAAFSELVRELGSSALPLLLRPVAEQKGPHAVFGRAGEDHEASKYVFNIAVSVAVGVPVNTTEGEEVSGSKNGRPEPAGSHGDGAPAVATATVHALPSAAETSVSSKPTPVRAARKTAPKKAARKPRRKPGSRPNSR